MCARTDAMISCRESDIVHYKEICEKHLHSNYVTTHKKLMGNLQRTSYRFSFVDVTLQVDALFDIVHSDKSWICRRWTSHAWRSALIVQRTETVLYHTLPWNFGGRFFGKIHHPGARFWLLASAWWFEMIENGSRLARKWRIRAGVEPNTTIGQLVKTWTPIGCGATNMMPTRMHGIENKI